MALLLLVALIAAFILFHPIAQHVIPQLGFVAVIAAALCGIARLKLALAGWLAAAIYFLAPVVPSYLPKTVAASPGCAMTVVSFNQLQNPPDAAGAARLIASLQPDLLFAQKVLAPERLEAALAANGLAGFATARSPRTLQLIASRYPISQVIDDTEGFSADVTIAGTAVRLFGLSITRAVDEGSDDPGHPAVYEAEYRNLIRALAAYRRPFILAGDGNSSPFSAEMRALKDQAIDSWDEAGFGLGATFPGPWRRLGRLGPFVRVDYILHDPSFTAVSVRRVDAADGAGHYPVAARLRFNGEGETNRPCL